MREYKVLVIGIGNILRSDDGLGPTVIKQLKQESWSSDILLVDCGTCPLAHLEQLSISRYLIIIDAIKNEQPAGTVHQFYLEEIKKNDTLNTTTHSYSMTQVIALAREINNLPQEIIYYGIEPATLDWGTEFSHSVREAIPQLIRKVKKKINIFSKK